MSNTVEIPLKTFKKIEKILEKLDKSAEPVEWLNEADACKLLGIKKSTMVVKVSRNEIPATHYTIGVNKVRFYNKQKLMGL